VKRKESFNPIGFLLSITGHSNNKGHCPMDEMTIGRGHPVWVKRPHDFRKGDVVIVEVKVNKV
jgi:hypothetical protein